MEQYGKFQDVFNKYVLNMKILEMTQTQLLDTQKVREDEAKIHSSTIRILAADKKKLESEITKLT